MPKIVLGQIVSPAVRQCRQSSGPAEALGIINAGDEGIADKTDTQILVVHLEKLSTIKRRTICDCAAHAHADASTFPSLSTTLEVRRAL